MGSARTREPVQNCAWSWLWIVMFVIGVLYLEAGGIKLVPIPVHNFEHRGKLNSLSIAAALPAPLSLFQAVTSHFSRGPSSRHSTASGSCEKLEQSPAVIVTISLTPRARSRRYITEQGSSTARYLAKIDDVCWRWFPRLLPISFYCRLALPELLKLRLLIQRRIFRAIGRH